MVMGRGSSRSVSEDDMYQMLEDNSDVLKQLSPSVTVSFPLKIGSDTVTSTSVTGVSEDYFSMKGYDITQGRGLQYTDMRNREKVCVVGQYLNMAYYGGSAVGQTLKVGQNTLTIVGVLAAEGSDLEEGGADDCVYLPYSTASRISSAGTISSYVVTVWDKDRISEAKLLVENQLYSIFEDDDAYNVISMSEMLDTMNAMVNVII